MKKNERPYQKLNARELEQQLAGQIRTPVEGYEITAFGDTERSWLAGPAYNMASHAVTANALTTTSDIVLTNQTVTVPSTGQQWTLETNYALMPDRTIKALGDTHVTDRSKPRGETDIEWLRRRVAEVLWVPA
jgi:hypothetical protein